MSLDKWDDRFLSVAKIAAGWSKDPNAKVGAVLVNDRRAIVAVSYNGFPIKVEDSEDRLADKDTKNEMVIHAEQNAVISAGHEARGGTMYVVGKPICPRCAGTLIQAGVARVVCSMPKDGTDSRWDKLGKISVEMFDEAGVQITEVPDEISN
jgi:dCMP deaminase